MIVSHARRYIFVHAPKTGGTALSLALEAKAAKDDILIGDTPKAKRRRHRLAGLETRGRLTKHATLADIDGLVDADALDDFRVFTIVRNPWDRMVSYYHWLRGQRFTHPHVAAAQRLGFGDFLAAPEIVAMGRAGYAVYVTDAAGRERCDLFLRFERLGEDVARLEDLLGLKIGPLPRVNVSDRDPDYRRYYDAASAARVAAAAAEDIARFGYAF